MTEDLHDEKVEGIPVSASTSATAPVHTSKEEPRPVTVAPESHEDGDAADEKDPNSPRDEDVVYPKGLKLAVILIALCCAVFLVALDQTIISTAIPKITDEFNSITDIGWYGSSYLLTTTALQPVFGRIYTIFSVGHPKTYNYVKIV